MRRSFLHAWGPALVWCAGIFWLSSMSYPPQLLPYFPFQDKVVHAVEFGILAVLFHRALTLRGPAWGDFSRLGVAFGMTLVYGAGDELHQTMVPGRQAEFLDWAADAAGGLMFLTATALWPGRAS